MNVSFDEQDIMKALNILMLLRGYQTEGHFDFRWRKELLITADIKPLKEQVSYENLKKYANR